MTYRARCSALPHLSLTPLLSPLRSNVQHGRAFPFGSVRGVRTGPNATRSLVLHLYTPALVGSTSHSNMGCSLAVRCEARGSPCGTKYSRPSRPCLHRHIARAFERVNYRSVGRLGSLCLLVQSIRIMIFHDDDFVVDSIVFFPLSFFDRHARFGFCCWW